MKLKKYFLKGIKEDWLARQNYDFPVGKIGLKDGENRIEIWIDDNF